MHGFLTVKKETRQSVELGFQHASIEFAHLPEPPTSMSTCKPHSVNRTHDTLSDDAIRLMLGGKASVHTGAIDPMARWRDN